MREESQSRERVKGVVWGLNTRGLGFDFKHYKGKLKLKRNCRKGPMDERGSLERSSRGTDCDCCIENVTNPMSVMLIQTKLISGAFSLPRSLSPSLRLTKALNISSIALWTSWPKAAWEQRGLFCLHFHITVLLSEESGPELIKQGKRLGQSWDRGKDGAAHWLVLTACSFCFLTASGPPAQRWRCPQGAEQSVTALQAYPQPDLMVTIFQLRVPPPRWHKVGIKLTLTSVIPKRPSLTEASLRDSHPAFGGICMHIDKDVWSVGRAAEHKVHSPFTYSWYTRREGDFHGIFNSLAHEAKLNVIGLLTYGVKSDLKRLWVLNSVLSFEYRMINCISCGTDGVH